ncbi:RNA polymerase sigma factor SigJ [Kribbella catacumbae]|uniref:RNA polymerase sigma factor SigJ n=1 Tax=Kribbella catacumbae TaxID=460086 RepID=UPI000373E7DF|nr:RNA polymerase sigma factor SigJ [Kribbella catacumbae]
MDEYDQLAGKFEQNRAQLRAVAYRMLGSVSEAEDAVQEAWLRLSRSDPSEIQNLGGWLTTVVSRVCLDQLRSRKTRREDPLDDMFVPDPILSTLDPEEEAVRADAVGLAMMVVLEKLSPAERLAFVLHDMFGLSFDEIAEIVDKTPAAARQLASRARRRVQGAPIADNDLNRQREVVDAFLAASRGGDFEALLSLLDPDVILRADAGTTEARGPAVSKLVRGALAVVEQALMFSRMSPHSRPALVNGRPGMITVVGDTLMGVMDVTIRDGKITEINILADIPRLKSLPIPA